MEKIKEILRSHRLNKYEIEQIAESIGKNAEKIHTLLLWAQEEDPFAWHAWWVCDHLAKGDHMLFCEHYGAIIRQLLESHHDGKQRLMLNVLMNTQSSDPISIPLLNFCLDNMLSPKKSTAVQASCIKMAYKLCQKEPELLPELKVILENADPDFFTPATKGVTTKVLKAIGKAQRGK
ncbi:MAG: hypothetical protein IK005_07130 [Paludibacteraceae bacterium]|nr:hypothetical protein [Paludibacteraceae bacterium]